MQAALAQAVTVSRQRHETGRVASAKESFCSIVANRIDDKTEADDARQFGGRGDQGHPARDAAELVTEDKIRIVLEGLRGEDSKSELCRREGIAVSQYYGWSKEFLEVGKRRLAGDTARAATSDEVKGLRGRPGSRRSSPTSPSRNRLLKRSMTGA